MGKGSRPNNNNNCGSRPRPKQQPKKSSDSTGKWVGGLISFATGNPIPFLIGAGVDAHNNSKTTPNNKRPK